MFPHSEKFRSNLLWCSTELFPLVLSLGTRDSSSALPCPSPLLRKLHRAMRLCLSFLFSRLDQPRALSCSHKSFLPAPHQLCCPPLEAFKDFHILPKLWGPELQSAQEKVTQILNTDEKSPLFLFVSFYQLVNLCLIHLRMQLQTSPDTQGLGQMMERGSV